MSVRALLMAAALILWVGPAAAQGFNFSRNNDEQIQVYADQGIEWQSEALRVIARGNAKAVRGPVTVTADTLTAHYRPGPDGDEIWRLDAQGNVTIATKSETATGDTATYDLDKAIFVLRGAPSRLVTPTETIVADETLEYWEKERMAVARGNAVATQKDRTLKADVITGHFKSGKNDSMELRRADAYDNVVLTTAKEEVTGKRGDYNVESGIATVTGSVRITRDGNELSGAYAHVNLNTGISKLFGHGPNNGGDGRVRGIFTPEKKDGEGGAKAVFSGASGGREKPATE